LKDGKEVKPLIAQSFIIVNVLFLVSAAHYVMVL